MPSIDRELPGDRARILRCSSSVIEPLLTDVNLLTNWKTFDHFINDLGSRGYRDTEISSFVLQNIPK